MQVSLGEIHAASGYLEKTLTVESGALDLDLPSDVHLPGPVQVQIQLRDLGDRITAQMQLAATARLQCSRCLEAFPTRLKGSFQGEFIPWGTEEDGDTVGTYGSNQVLELRDFIRESLLMLIPFKSLCREDCRGICPECGTNLNIQQCHCLRENIDPRWAALAKIRKT